MLVSPYKLEMQPHTCMDGLSIHEMTSGGAPAATAASRTMRAASTVHLAALQVRGQGAGGAYINYVLHVDMCNSCTHNRLDECGIQTGTSSQGCMGWVRHE